MKGIVHYEYPDLHHAKLLAEILRIQRWAGGESVSADRIFGLMHGFETVLREEAEGFGISAETQEKVEDLLDDVEAGKQSTDGMSIKDRLHADGVNENDAAKVMTLYRLEDRFIDGIEKIAQGNVFPGLKRPKLPEQGWRGALHYMELVDCTEGAYTKLHAAFAPALPRRRDCNTTERITNAGHPS